MKILSLLLLAGAAWGQITVGFAPDTASQTALIGQTHGLCYYVLILGNNGPTTRTLYFEQVILAAIPQGVNLIPLGDAKNIIAAKVARSFWGRVLHVSSVAGEFIVLGVALAKAATPSIGASALLKVVLAGSALTGADQIASANLASGSGLYSTLTWPIAIQPGAYVTDHEFATGWEGKKWQPKAVVLSIP